MQKQTAAALSAYKAADVPGALKSTIAAQSAFDQRMLDSVIAEEGAVRDAELAEVLSGTFPPDPKPATAPRTSAEPLSKRIHDRLSALGGGHFEFVAAQWDRRRAVDIDAQEHVDDATRQVSIFASAYSLHGGTGFKSYDTPFDIPTTATADARNEGRRLQDACGALAAREKTLRQVAAPIEAACTADSPGLLARICNQVTEIQAAIEDDRTAAVKAANELRTAKEKFKTATEGSQLGVHEEGVRSWH